MNDLDEISMSERLSNGGLTTEEALHHATDLADAVRRIHQRGTICTSLDPNHILLGGNGLRLVQNGAGGTAPYISPEQLRGEAPDVRSDIFVFGAIFYELLSGRRAFPSEDSDDLKRELLDLDPLPVEGIPVEITSVLRRCLEKRREDRWQRMNSVLIELKLAATNARHAQQASEWKERMLSQRAQLAGIEDRLSAHQDAPDGGDRSRQSDDLEPAGGDCQPAAGLAGAESDN